MFLDWQDRRPNRTVQKRCRLSGATSRSTMPDWLAGFGTPSVARSPLAPQPAVLARPVRRISPVRSRRWAVHRLTMAANRGAF